MSDKIPITCPLCGRVVTHWNGKSKIAEKVKCSKCNKAVIFDPETGERIITNVPSRHMASGMRFY